MSPTGDTDEDSSTTTASKIITFSKPLEFEFEGNVYQNAITLGDVDNDGLGELIVGNDIGKVAIFKGANPKPVRVASELGLVATLSVGDILNIGRNVLLVVTAYGMSHMYDLGRNGLSENEETSELKPFHTQKLPANVKCAVIGDINGDKMLEVAFALTDRVVRTYKWVDSEESVGSTLHGKLVPQNKWELSDQIGGIILHNTDGKHPTLLVSQPGATCFTLDQPRDTGKEFDEQVFERLNKMSAEYDNLDRTGCCNPKMPTEICGSIELDGDTSFDHFKAMSSAPLSGSSSFLDSETDKDTLAYVLATVDGMIMLYRDKKIIWKVNLQHPIISVSLLYVPFHKSQRTSSSEDLHDDTPDDSSSEGAVASTPPIRHIFPFRTPTRGIPLGISTPSTPSRAIPTPDNNSHLGSNRDKSKKSFVTKIIACSSDGSTFIMNVIDGTHSLFKFQDSINTFATGFYGYKGRQHSCIAYSSFSDKIYLYHEVGKTLKFKPKVTDLLRTDMMYVDAVKSLGIDIDNREQMRQLNSYLLYGITDFTVKKGIKLKK